MRELEHKEAVALMQWCAVNSSKWPELELLYAIPNGGQRHVAVAAKMKREGVKKGVPDYCLPVARRGHHGLYIELKAGRGRPTKEQAAWIGRLSDEGYRAIICWGWYEASLELTAYLT